MNRRTSSRDVDQKGAGPAASRVTRARPATAASVGSAKTSRARPQRTAPRPARRVTPPAPEPAGPLAALFDRAIDVGLMGATFGVPLVLGGRIEIGKLLLVVCAVWCAVLWSLRQLLGRRGEWVWTWTEPLLLAGAAVFLAQIAELPADLIHKLSPHTAELLPLWQGDGQLGLPRWATLSFMPAQTRSALATYCAYALLFYVTAQRIRTTEDVERLLRWIALGAVGMAGLGIAQYFAGNGKYFWTYAHPTASPIGAAKGSFTNENHFAQFLALGVGPLMWWIVRSLGTDREGSRRGPRDDFGTGGAGRALVGLLVIGLGVLGFAALLSLSRGGAVALAVAGFVTLVLLALRGMASGRLLAAVTVIGLLIGALLFLYGFDAVSASLDEWGSDREAIWRANGEVLEHHPILGSGAGSHLEAYPTYLDLPQVRLEFTHAESGYVQVASEAGLVGLSVVGLAVFWTLTWCLRGVVRARRGNTIAAAAAVTGALLANFVHSIADFVWYVPGCMVIVVILAAAACRLCQLARMEARAESGRAVGRGYWTMPRPLFAAPLAGAVCLGMWLVPLKLPQVAAEQHWHQFQRLTAGDGGFAFADDTDDDIVAGATSTDQGALLSKQTAALVKAAHADPGNARLQMRLAMAYVNAFQDRQAAHGENAMTVVQLRDAVFASEFETAIARDEWLNRAAGEDVKLLHAALRSVRRSLRLCPLQGNGYALLAELAFLEDADPEAPGACLAQALAVRPYDASVLFWAGREAWGESRPEDGLAYWKRAFDRDAAYQQRIIDVLSDQLTARSIVALLKPDWPALKRICHRFRQLDRPDELDYVLRLYADESVAQAKSSTNEASWRAWLQAHATYDELGELDRAQECLNAALAGDPNAFKVRHALGTWLYRRQRFAEAAEHLAWCSKRRPQDQKLREMTKRSMTEQLQSAGRRAAEAGVQPAGYEAQ